VDVERARAILGVRAQTPLEDVRRAYLRLVRLHNPEVDPQGFAEIRAAFELLRAATDGGGAAPGPGGAADGSAEAGRPEAGAEPPGPFAIALAQLEATPPMAIEARTSIIERAAAAQPDDPRLVWLAVEELAPFPYVFARLVGILRRAADRGVPGALEHLSFYAPGRVTAAETEALLASSATGERLLGARLLIDTGHAGDAAAIVEQVVEPAALGTRPLPVAGLIDLALHCLQKGSAASARRIDAAMTVHFERFQDEAAVLTPGLAVLRGIFQELLGLAALFPASAIISIARLLRGVGGEHPLEVGRTLLTLPGQPQDKAMVRFLAGHAPMLSQALNMNAVIANYGRDAHRVPWWQIAGGVIMVLVLSLVRMDCSQRLRRSDGVGGDFEPSRAIPREAIVSSVLESYANQRCEDHDARSARDCMRMRQILVRLSGRHCDRELMMPRLELDQSPEMQMFMREAAAVATGNCAAAESRESGESGTGLSGGGAP